VLRIALGAPHISRMVLEPEHQTVFFEQDEAVVAKIDFIASRFDNLLSAYELKNNKG
jgi:hypothetical protein